DDPAGIWLEVDVTWLRLKLGPLVLDCGEERRVPGAVVVADDAPIGPGAVRVVGASRDGTLSLLSLEADRLDGVVVGAGWGLVLALDRARATGRADVLRW